ncbi:pt repeat family protein [Ophiostoma piceae UAMH 11346]|uniref:Pt repeat family protein n=1 Tax=Ophiostoma piceae (strain UAMH 11346) TaxID=1262450 RepID=S3CQS9_OPHP1|nr:pt repeat family protein [Ophiostoma piceae UAMH 11346]
MTFDSRSYNHPPGSPLHGGRTVASSGSHSFLRKLTSFTKRSKSQPLAASSSYTTARFSLPTPPSSPPSSSSSAPNRMALAAAQTASLKATVNAGLLTPPSTARPASSTTRPLSRPKTAAPGTSSSAFSSAGQVTCNAPLAVQVEIRFPGLDGLRNTPSYTHEYSSSHDLQVSNQLCKGLLRRLTHCSSELITRRDSEALKQQQRHGHPASAKLLSYELHFRILRKDSGVWAEKTFCSYQKQDMSTHDAYEVILATHRMVGLFMRRHDPGFRWSDAPQPQTTFFAPRPEVPELVSHTVDRPLPLSCIPRSRFLDDSQSFEFVPGYAIQLSFRSRCHARKQYEWKRAISLQSNQSAPLNLVLAEDLLWQTFESVNSALSTRRQVFHDEHKACEFLEGVVSCQHFDEDALDIELKIQNNLGPNYTHLTRSIHSKLALFRHVDGADCQEFIHNVHSRLLQSRETADLRANSLPDFDYRITTLKTPAWSVDNPARFVLDASTSYSRRSIEAILDRVETGISDVLRNKGCTIHVVAYKRGHLILDKSVATNLVRSKPALFPKAPVDEDAGEIIAKLKERIHQDINAVCKDTCSLDSLDNIDDLRELAAEARAASFAKQFTSSSPPMTPTAEKFESTVILEESSMIDNEPIVPPPRVVELPADFYLGDSRTSSPASSTRRRAFPLVPEKFVLPPSRGPSPGSSTPPTTKVAALQVPTVEAVASTPEPTVIELAEMLAETLAEIVRDMADPAPSDPLTEVPVDIRETRCEAPSGPPEASQALSEAPVIPENPQALSEAQHDVPEKSHTLIDAPVDILEEAQEDIATEIPVQASSRTSTEVLLEPSADEGVATPVEELLVDSEPDREESDQELVAEHSTPHISLAEATTVVIPAVEDESFESCFECPSDDNAAENSLSEGDNNASAPSKLVESYLPQALLTFDGDSETEPDDQAQEELCDAAFDSDPSFYSFYDDSEEPSPVQMQLGREGSTTAGTMQDTFLEPGDETNSEFEIDFPVYDQGLTEVPLAESSEFSFDLPAYDQGLPNIPSADDVQAISTPQEISEASENSSLDNYDLPADSDDELSELELVSQPVFEEPTITAAEVDDDDGSEFSDDEPLTFSSPSRKSRTVAGPTSIQNVGSPDLTRPSTPSLSLSSRGFNSPETSYLETPEIRRDFYPAMITCFDSDNDTRYGHPYDADGKSEHEQHFTAFSRDQKPVAETSVALVALDESHPPDQPLAAPISPIVCEISESDSTATEICRKADRAITDIEVASSHSKPELDLQVSTPPLALEPDTSFEDFAMTKPDIDMDEFADVANDELDAELYNDITLPNDTRAEADADEFQLPDYDGARSFQQDAEPETVEPALLEVILVGKTIVEVSQEDMGKRQVAPGMIPLPDSDDGLDETTDAMVREQLEEPRVCPAMIPLPESEDGIDEEKSYEHIDSSFLQLLDLPRSSTPMFQPAMRSDSAEDDIVTFVPLVDYASIIAHFEGPGAAPERERRRLSLYRYDYARESLLPVAQTSSDVETEHVSEAEPTAEIESVPATETPRDSEVSVLTETFTIAPSHDLVDELSHEEVDELALSEGGAPSSGTSVIYDELVSPEVPTHRGLELMDSKAEAPPVTDTPTLDNGFPVEQDLQVSEVVAETPSTAVAVLEVPTDGDAANDESPTSDDASTLHFSSHAADPESCLHVSEATPAAVDSFGLCHMGVLPTPPESEDEFDVRDDVDVESEHTDLVVVPRDISSEEENKRPTQEAAPLISEEEMARLFSTATSNDTTIQNETMTDMLGPERGTTDIPVDITPSLPEEDLGSGLDALDLAPTPVEALVTAGVHTIASENLKPEPLSLAVEEFQLDAHLEETNGIETTGEVKATASIPPARCSVSWFLPKAGIVGLDESKLVRVGLRGALTGSRAFDNVPSQTLDLRAQDTRPTIDDDIDLLSVDEDHEETTAEQEEPSAPKQVEETLPESSPSADELPPPPTSMAIKKHSASNQDVALPRVIMAFASMAVMSQIINRSSSN